MTSDTVDTDTLGTDDMHVVWPRAAGLDVHKMCITAAVRLCAAGSGPARTAAPHRAGRPGHRLRTPRRRAQRATLDPHAHAARLPRRSASRAHLSNPPFPDHQAQCRAVERGCPRRPFDSGRRIRLEKAARSHTSAVTPSVCLPERERFIAKRLLDLNGRPDPRRRAQVGGADVRVRTCLDYGMRSAHSPSADVWIAPTIGSLHRNIFAVRASPNARIDACGNASRSRTAAPLNVEPRVTRSSTITIRNTSRSNPWRVSPERSRSASPVVSISDRTIRASTGGSSRQA